MHRRLPTFRTSSPWARRGPSALAVLSCVRLRARGNSQRHRRPAVPCLSSRSHLPARSVAYYITGGPPPEAFRAGAPASRRRRKRWKRGGSCCRPGPHEALRSRGTTGRTSLRRRPERRRAGPPGGARGGVCSCPGTGRPGWGRTGPAYRGLRPGRPLPRLRRNFVRHTDGAIARPQGL